MATAVACANQSEKNKPTVAPSNEATAEPTTEPTEEPIAEPTAEPTVEPTTEPTVEPTAELTAEPIAEVTTAPTDAPTMEPTPELTKEPTPTPEISPEPTKVPTAAPTQAPTPTPSPVPTPTPSPTPTSSEWTEVTGVEESTGPKNINPVLHGRVYTPTSTRYGLAMQYPAQGFTFGFKGTSLEIQFTKSNAWAKVTIDDKDYVFGNPDGSFIKVADGLDGNVIHKVTVLKRSEGNTSELAVKKLKISAGGKYYSTTLDQNVRRIEFLGDSITCGWGNLYGLVTPTTTDQNELEDGTNTYATVLAKHYGAEASICAISGIGVGNAANMPYGIMGSYVTNGTKAMDFTKNIPDVVIIALGTNDASCGNLGQEFIDNGKELVSFIRKNYPDACIIWTYGIMGTAENSNIQTIVKYFNDNGDNNVFAWLTSTKPGEKEGGAGHPNINTNQRLADELAAIIDANVDW